MADPIRVLIVDDSAVVRQSLEDLLNEADDIEVMGTAADPYFAVERIAKQVPDVVVLDVEMPRMDGITFLRKIMSQHPIPVVMCSSLTIRGAETTFHALEYGAVEIILKPKMGLKEFFEESKITIQDTVRAAARARIRPIADRPLRKDAPLKKLNADAVLSLPAARAMVRTTERIVVVGASTGGTEALRIFLEAMPVDCPGIVIVQHMPEKFTTAFAERLNGICAIQVKEAEDGDSVIRGRALIGPGNRHILVKRSGARYFVSVKDGPLVTRHRPSVDVLFRSAARYAGKNVVGVIMTGMGDDGAQGMKEMKDAGAENIAQDEATSVVFGMPREAILRGGVDHILPLTSITAKVIELADADPDEE